MKTLVYCTAYSKDQDGWTDTYGRWINYLENSKIEYDQLLLVDDGSPVLPEWDGVKIIQEGELPDVLPEERAVIYHHNINLGHKPPRAPNDPPINAPGWHRSYMFGATYAEKYGFDKIIHIESDAFLISERIQTYVNGLKDKWTTFWCPRHQFPEAGIQIIAGSSVDDFFNWNKTQGPYETEFKGIFAEFYVPFTNVNRGFYGDRWGEFAPGMARVADPNCPPGVPRNADFVCQVFPESPCWWIEN